MNADVFEASVPIDGAQHHGGRLLSKEPLTAETSPLQWDYAVSVPLSLKRHAPELARLPVKVSALVTVTSGELGCLLVGDDWSTPLGSMPSAVGPGTHTLNLLWERGGGEASLVFRNHGAGNRTCLFRVDAVRLAAAPPDAFDQAPRLADVLASDGRRVDVSRLRGAVLSADAMHGDEHAIFGALRRKWSVVPAGIMGRRGTSDLANLADHALRQLWTDIHREATTGEGFSVRGWYQTIYRDVLRGKKVLEIGSGMGIDGIEFACNGARMTFVDIVEANLDIMKRLCAIFGVRDARFLYLDSLAALDSLDDDYDVVWCQGSLINAPFEFMKRECASIVRHLREGGRWIELAYPCERWVRDGEPPFRTWGCMTDGEGTPWVEWYDLPKLLDRMAPVRFTPVLAMNFHDDDYNWFDLIKTD